jgi:hypothetical protein
MIREQLKAQYEAEIAVDPEGWKNWQLLNVSGWVNALAREIIDFSDCYEHRRNLGAGSVVAYAVRITKSTSL